VTIRSAAADAEIHVTMDGTEPTQLVPKKVKRRADVGLSAVNLANVIPTWGVATFDFTITAPAEPGTYNFQRHMQASKGGAFGEAAPLKRVSVVAPEEYQRLLASFATDPEPERTNSGRASIESSASRENPPPPVRLRPGRCRFRPDHARK
jgi:hypothetical protein